MSPFLQQVLDQNPNAVKLVFLNFPLSSHPMAMKAAKAALAAHEQGKFWEFHEKLHKAYQVLNEKKILTIAEEMKLDMEKFNADMNSTAISDLITRDIKTGKEIGIRGIPSLFVNGKAVQEITPDGLQKMLDRELKKRHDKNFGHRKLSGRDLTELEVHRHE